MDKQIQTDSTEAFLQKVIIQELGKVQQAGLSYMHFVLMGQAVEVLGGFLDTKPVKAKGQSSKRFSLAVNRLFGGRYRLLNDNHMLYDKLRNQMTHAFIPSSDLLLLNRQDPSGHYRHLEYTDGKLVLVGETFYADICTACSRLTRLLKEGKVKAKNIAFGEYER